MKKYLTTGLSVLTITSFVACGTNDRSGHAAQLAKADAKTAAKDSSKNIATVCQGGQPGLISLGGMIWQVMESSVQVVDSHIKVIATAGNSNAGKATTLNDSNQIPIKSSAPSQETLNSINSLADAKTYINIGCTDIENDVKQMPGFSEVKVDLVADAGKIQDFKVTRIFICGKQEIALKLLTLTATEIIMKDQSELSFKDLTSGSIAINTEKLTLTGSSAIKVNIASALKFADLGTVLSLYVTKPVETGTDSKGQLTISSNGGACLEAPATTAK